MGEQKRIIRISSARRNRQLYPQPNQYRIHAPLNGLSRLCQIRLLNYIIPNSMYNIGTNNSTFSTRNSGGVLTTLTIPPGSYSPTTLATEIEIASGHVISVSYESRTGKYLMTSVTLLPFSIESGSLCPAIGFNSPTPLAVSHYSDNVINLGQVPVIYLRLNDLTCGSGALVGEFGAIYNDVSFGDIMTGSPSCRNEYDSVATWRGSAPAFTEFEISFVDEWGRPINFNGVDHLLEFEVVGF